MEALQSPANVISVDVHAAKDLLSLGFRYLDVRTTEEFKKSRVEEAVNVPYMFITPEGRIKNPDFLDQVALACAKEERLIVACNSGGRSLRACIDLESNGYTNVKNMEGGYSSWVDSGYAGEEKPADALKTSCKFRP